MGIKKKHYFYDLEQFVDKNKKLLFLVKTIPLHPSGSIYILIDCHLNETAFNDLSELTPVELTFKKVVNTVCEYFDFSHRSPLGFLEETRNIAICLCFKFTYQDVSIESGPTLQNLADIFRMSHSNLLKMLKNHEKSIKSKPSFNEIKALLTKSVSCCLSA